jgi:hypothetical protein
MNQTIYCPQCKVGNIEIYDKIAYINADTMFGYEMTHIFEKNKPFRMAIYMQCGCGFSSTVQISADTAVEKSLWQSIKLKRDNDED